MAGSGTALGGLVLAAFRVVASLYCGPMQILGPPRKSKLTAIFWTVFQPGSTTVFPAAAVPPCQSEQCFGELSRWRRSQFAGAPARQLPPRQSRSFVREQWESAVRISKCGTICVKNSNKKSLIPSSCA